MSYFQFLSWLSKSSNLQATPHAPHFKFGSPEKFIWRHSSNFSLDMTLALKLLKK